MSFCFLHRQIASVLALVWLTCGTVSAQETPAAPTPSTLKMPEYFGVFARMKDGSRIELERKDVFKTKWIVGDTIASMQLVTSPYRDFTLGVPKVELELGLVDHFLFHFDKDISDQNCSLHHFYCVQGLRGKFFDFKGNPPTPIEYWNAFINLGWKSDQSSGLRMGKASENLYKMGFKENDIAPKMAKIMMEGTDGAKIPVNVCGLYYEGAVYQFRLKHPAVPGEKKNAFTLDFTAYPRDKQPGLELGEALLMSEVAGKPVLKGNEGGRFAPANLHLTGDFTVIADMTNLPFNSFSISIQSEKSAYHVSATKPMHFSFAGKKVPIPLDPPKPTPKRSKGAKAPPPEPPTPFRFIWERKGNTLTLTCKGVSLGSVPFPSSEPVTQVVIAGFAKDTAIHHFTITSP